MFHITRLSPFDGVRELMNTFTSEPFVRMDGPSVEQGSLALDIAEGDGELVVTASLPGFKPEDVDVQVHNGVLSIKAEHAEETEAGDERFYRRERRVGAVSRRIVLPGEVADASATAELTDGVLTLRIPQAEAVRPKKIPVN